MQLARMVKQPPSGGCELKHYTKPFHTKIPRQPPSGGCELKLAISSLFVDNAEAAAFGRL